MSSLSPYFIPSIPFWYITDLTQPSLTAFARPTDLLDRNVQDFHARVREDFPPPPSATIRRGNSEFEIQITKFTNDIGSGPRAIQPRSREDHFRKSASCGICQTRQCHTSGSSVSSKIGWFYGNRVGRLQDAGGGWVSPDESTGMIRYPRSILVPICKCPQRGEISYQVDGTTDGERKKKKTRGFLPIKVVPGGSKRKCQKRD